MDENNSLESAVTPRPAGNRREARASWAGGVRLEALANLAHELRTPMQVTLGYLDILREEWAKRLADEPRQILTRMNASVLQLAQTVENIMEFALADAGADARVEQDLALKDLIEELKPTFEAVNEKGLVLKYDLEGAPSRIRSQRRALRLIVLNLMLNAIKFTAVGTVTLAVRRERLGVEIAVRDTGQGFSVEQIEAAWEPFTQLSSSSIRRYRGVGLGLAVVRRNVVALGGILDARSTPGVGSTFVVIIPARPAKNGNGRSVLANPPRHNGAANGNHRNSAANHLSL